MSNPPPTRSPVLGERQVIVPNLTIEHKGFFSSIDIERLVETHFIKRGYTLKSKENEVIADPKNKQHIIIVKYTKKTSEYDVSVAQITFHFSHIAKELRLKNGRKTACEKGELTVSFRGISDSAKEGFIGYTPIRYFFVFMRSKFITKKYDYVPGKGLERDIKNAYEEIYLYIKHTDYKEIESDEERTENAS